MARKKQKPAQSIKLWSEEISKEYDRWNFLYKEGGSDPFWPDGCGLNWGLRQGGTCHILETYDAIPIFCTPGRRQCNERECS